MRSLILYIQFFTRIPLPIAVDNPIEQMKSGVKYFTLFGFLVGLMEAIVFFIVSRFTSFNLAWIFVLFFDVILTGGFHLDAIADMADGLFSSRKKERMLEIMKDSRIGSNGVIALIFYYLICVFSFVEVSDVLDLKTVLFMVIGFHIVGKQGISLLFYKMVYSGSNPDGLGTVFVGATFQDILISQIIGLLFLFSLFGYMIGLTYIFMYMLIFLYRRMVYHKIGGVNGDILGSAAPLSQMCFMLLLPLVV